MQNVQPIYILPENTQRSTGKSAQSNNILAAKLVAQTVRTTLGPKGMDKMIVDSLGEVIVTNDGVTILKEMQIEHPAAKMIVEIAKTQEQEVGDGTTTAVILAGELLKQAEELLDENIHPTIIVKGYRLASEKALEVINSISSEIDFKSKELIANIASTAMTGKGAESSKVHLSDMISSSVLDVIKDGKFDKDDIRIEVKSGESVDKSALIKGIVIDKEKVHPNMPKKIENAKIALINCALEVKSTENDAKININDPMQLNAFLEQEEKMIKDMTDKIISTGANVLISQKGIDDMAQYFLAKKGIYAIRRVRETDLKQLSKATGANIVSKINDLTSEDLGFAGNVQEKYISDEYMTFVQNCKNPKAVTLFVRGSTEHVVNEIKRAIEDALGDIESVIKTKRVVYGAGSCEIELSKKLRKYAQSLSGKEQLAVTSFANALEIIPKTLAENSGLDSIDILTSLKSEHDKGNLTYGVDVFSGKIVDSKLMNIIEPITIKTQAIISATEVAAMILRIDDVIIGSKNSNNSNVMPPQGM